jgi:hypothetical protein
MYLRFVVSEIDQDTSRELGVFHALEKLRNGGALDKHEEETDDEVHKWFDKHLKKPDRLTAAKPPYYRKQNKAISWFKDTAREHIAQIRLLMEILKNHGVSVKMLRTDRVGYIVYEDEFQIVAEPFAKDTY